MIGSVCHSEALRTLRIRDFWDHQGHQIESTMGSDDQTGHVDRSLVPSDIGERLDNYHGIIRTPESAIRMPDPNPDRIWLIFRGIPQECPDLEIEKKA